jgi:lytic murein transglycosylase
MPSFFIPILPCDADRQAQFYAFGADKTAGRASSRVAAKIRKSAGWFAGIVRDNEADTMRRLRQGSIIPRRLKNKKFSRQNAIWGLVMPRESGASSKRRRRRDYWIPAFAGMTAEVFDATKTTISPSWPGLSRPSTSLGCGDSKTWMPGIKPGMTGMWPMHFLFAILISVVLTAPARADAAFAQWLETVWPQAQSAGVSRATFDAAIRNLEPDLSLPDLAIPGRAEKPPPGQPEFVLTPSQYLKESSFDRLAAEGRKLAVQHRDTLLRIEQEIGVPGNIVLAIWARETDYGRYKLPHDAIRVLATQAYVGKRQDLFRAEFIAALRLLQDGVPRSALRSSWGGALGMTQFLPSEFYKYAVDFDGDGRADIWTSVPDALASAAKQLAGKGWQAGEAWAYEVRAPAGIDCTIAEPGVTLPVGEWLQRGFVPADGRAPGAGELAATASLLLPEGTYGPAFLTPKNYYVLKDYNFSDLYVLFVGHLSDRIAGRRAFVTPWSKSAQLKTKDVESMQRRLSELGLYKDKIDGKAGMLTRAALGAYQKVNSLKLDCWPSASVLDHMRR